MSLEQSMSCSWTSMCPPCTNLDKQTIHPWYTMSCTKAFKLKLVLLWKMKKRMLKGRHSIHYTRSNLSPRVASLYNSVYLLHMHYMPVSCGNSTPSNPFKQNEPGMWSRSMSCPGNVQGCPPQSVPDQTVVWKLDNWLSSPTFQTDHLKDFSWKSFFYELEVWV